MAERAPSRPDPGELLSEFLDEWRIDRRAGRTNAALHERIGKVEGKVDALSDEYQKRVTTLEANAKRDAEERANGTGRHLIPPQAILAAAHQQQQQSPPPPAVSVNIDTHSTPTKRPSKPPWTSELLSGGITGAAKRVGPWVGLSLATWAFGHFGTSNARIQPVAAQPLPAYVATTNPYADIPTPPTDTPVTATALPGGIAPAASASHRRDAGSTR